MIKLLRFIDLHNGEDAKEKVLENVTSNISFRGSNLWILALCYCCGFCGLECEFYSSDHRCDVDLSSDGTYRRCRVCIRDL